MEQPAGVLFGGPRKQDAFPVISVCRKLVATYAKSGQAKGSSC